MEVPSTRKRGKLERRFTDVVKEDRDRDFINATLRKFTRYSSTKGKRLTANLESPINLGGNQSTRSEGKDNIFKCYIERLQPITMLKLRRLLLTTAPLFCQKLKVKHIFLGFFKH